MPSLNELETAVISTVMPNKNTPDFKIDCYSLTWKDWTSLLFVCFVLLVLYTALVIWQTHRYKYKKKTPPALPLTLPPARRLIDQVSPSVNIYVEPNDLNRTRSRPQRVTNRPILISPPQQLHSNVIPQQSQFIYQNYETEEQHT